MAAIELSKNVQSTGFNETEFKAVGNPLTGALKVELAADTDVIGLVSIDQTTVGTTDSVTVKASAGIGALTEGAPADDTASSGLNGRLQRVAQRLTSLIALLPAAFTAGGGVKTGLVDALPAGTNLLGKVGIDQTTPGTTNKVSIGTDGTVAINAAVPAGTNLIGNFGIDQTTAGTTDSVTVKASAGIGSLTETAPVTDTASSGLNGRLQRIAAHLTNVVSYTSRLLSSTGPKAAGAALATTALQVGGTHTTVLPTMTDTQEGGLQLDASGRLIVSGTFWQTTQPVSIAAAVVLAGFTPVTITTATTTLVKSGAGLLHGITVNSLGTVASTIEVYDALTATGTPIAIIDSLTLSGQFLYDLNFATGLTLVTTGTVAPNLTVSYR